jgi:F-type H+-transporting ATPase subunit delta
LWTSTSPNSLQTKACSATTHAYLQRHCYDIVTPNGTPNNKQQRHKENYDVTAVEGYANALFEIAQAESATGPVQAELSAFAEAMGTNAALASALTDQFIPTERRMSVVSELLGAKAHPVTTNLVSFLVGAGRAKELPAIVAAMRAKSASSQGKAAGDVRSAIAMSAEQQQRLTDAVSKQLGKSVELTFIVDESILGGVITTVGDTVIDGSVKRRLELMKDAI